MGTFQTMSLLGTVGDICGQPGEMRYQWKVENFFSLSEAVDVCYDSPAFQFSGRYFHLRLYPNGQSWFDSEGWISLYLKLGESCSPMEVDCTLGIKTVDGKIKKLLTGTSTFKKKNWGWGETKALARSEISRRREEIVPSDALTINATLKTDFQRIVDGTSEVSVQTDEYVGDLNGNQAQENTGASEVAVQTDDIRVQEGNQQHPENTATTDVAVQTNEDVSYQDVNEGRQHPEYTGTTEVAVQTSVDDVTGQDGNEGLQSPEKTGCEKVGQDIAKLWCSSQHSDVIVKVSDVEFKAHRTILAARTPVFSAMFRHETEEKVSGIITIGDCQPTVFEEFLHFVYTGAPRELTTENAPALYALAEKYLVEELKMQCLQCIQDTLCVETFCNAVVLALTHEEKELLAQANAFAAENIRSIIRTVDWQRLLSAHPIWANEILIKALGV